MIEARYRCYGCMNLKTQPICEHCGWDERRNNAPHQLPVGTLLRDQYVIGRALGQGGFGITYLGWDNYLDIPVAIKEYYPSGIVTRESAVSTVVCNYDGEIGDRFQKSKERFMRESRMLARFSDMPEVVQVKSFFLANNTAYIVMEYVQGITMKEYVRRAGGRLTMERTLEMLRPVIQTLDKLHREGIVHRDISPDNIMILPNGRMKLIDFGAVRDVGHADADMPLSRSTEAILKQGFAPIEQYQNRGSLGPWTDVYALCATIYYCVTGHVLLDAPGRLLDSPELNLRQVASMTPQQEQAMNRGLELLPAKRTRSMAELEQGLYAVDYGHTIPLEDDGKTIPLDDGKTIPLDDNRTIPLDRDKTVPKRDETKPLEDVVVEDVKPEKPKRKFDPKLLFLAAVLAVCVIWGILFSPFSPFGAQGTTIEGNVIMEDPMSVNFEGKLTIFGTGCTRESIVSVTFLDSTSSAPYYAWDISQKQDGSVLAWTEGTEFSFVQNSYDPNKDYDLYIAGDGGVVAPVNCGALFVEYGASEFNFNGNFDTSNVESTNSMFACCTSVVKMDLSELNFDNVKTCELMFSNCANLQSLVLPSFGTSDSINAHNMFRSCNKLTLLGCDKNTTINNAIMTAFRNKE